MYCKFIVRIENEGNRCRLVITVTVLCSPSSSIKYARGFRTCRLPSPISFRDSETMSKAELGKFMATLFSLFYKEWEWRKFQIKEILRYAWSRDYIELSCRISVFRGEQEEIHLSQKARVRNSSFIFVRIRSFLCCCVKVNRWDHHSTRKRRIFALRNCLSLIWLLFQKNSFESTRVCGSCELKWCVTQNLFCDFDILFHDTLSTR